MSILKRSDLQPIVSSKKRDPRSDYYRRKKFRKSGKHSSNNNTTTTATSTEEEYLQEENSSNHLEKHSSFVVKLVGRRRPDGGGGGTAIPPPPSSTEVMTWFKGCASGPPTQHSHSHQGGRNSRSGMGAAESRSSRDALAKSRSQSSSALYHPPPPPSGAGNATTTTPIGNAVSASMWDIPHQHNQSPAKVRHHHHPKDNKRCCNLNKIVGGNNSRSKLYAVSCPDVAHQALIAHNHQHQGHPPATTANKTHQYQNNIPEEALHFILPPPEGYRTVVVPPHHHQANCPLSRDLLLQSHQHHSLTQLHLNNSGVPQPAAAACSMNGPMSLSYSHLPSSYLLQQHPLMTSLNHTHHSHHNHNYNNASRVVPPPPQQSEPVKVRHTESAPDLDSIFPAFVIPENIFEVHLTRDGRGLGLSVTGGRDSGEKFPGLIRIKKVFPASPASECGRILGWDVILQANGTPLTGLANHEALSVLRTTPTTTILTLCRPPPYTPGFSDSPSSTVPDHPHFPYNSYNPHHNQEPHLPQQKSKSLSSLKIPQNSITPNNSKSGHFGEFEVTLEKVCGSLGFTLRQEDTSILGHYVRALVKEPALSDGRIQPGDKIISVNGTDLSGLSHGDAINFLRQCGSSVTLRLWRDVSPTPVSPLSPSESVRGLKPKPLRQEALDMLNDLAVRKQSAEWKHSLPGSVSVGGGGGGGRSCGLRTHNNRSTTNTDDGSNGPATLPRRRGVNQHTTPIITPSPEVLSAALSRFASPKETNVQPQPSQPPVPPLEDDDESRSSGSGESTPMSKKAGLVAGDPYRAYTDLRSDSIVSANSTLNENEEDAEDGELKHRWASFNNRHHNNGVDQNHTSEPNFRSGQPKYQSAILPSTATSKNKKRDGTQFGSGFRLPPALFERGEAETESGALSDEYLQTQQSCDDRKGRKKKSLSSTTPTTTSSLSSSSSSSGGGKLGNSTLLKWKGVLLEDDEDDKHASGGSDRHNYLSVDVDLENGTRRSPDGREFRECDVEISATTQENGEQIFTVELSRRWCSRLGFSLQGRDGHTHISAVYPNSVASKDGRLRVGDELVMVNGETIRDMDTSQVIDMMRKTRGIISITLLRRSEGNGDGGSGSESEMGLR
ncbi:uncharacterized protein LOC110842661 isoform X2 [Folsomia candida]|uniref:Tyrosine-protein phosphatase non-receptor type 13 n=1 Tax=Folsomia candida TaxID=158441 RepID=A0A226ERW1_FOLCA|nr:uncharacterized protein LOC110842661 isoform X2 [Folsomia candida]OXA60375.1 Tyrosine-protein phosphatase non-receptor type 13 [Folsomia candida]